MTMTTRIFLFALAAVATTLPSSVATPIVDLGSSRIVTGVDAEPCQFPYFAQFESGCGGSLIAPDIVLTSATCKSVIGVGDGVVVGAYRWGRDNEFGAKKRFCKEFVVHPKYIRSRRYHFALCKLNKPVFIDESFVRLELSKNVSAPVGGTRTISIGMGWTNNKVGDNITYPEVLQNVTIPTRSNGDCNRDHSFFDPHIELCMEYYPNITLTPCNGVSGAPVLERVYQGDGSFVDVQHGLTSDRTYCKNGFNARISGEIEWIRSTSCLTLRSIGSMCDTITSPSTSPSISPSTSPSISPSTSPSTFPVVLLLTSPPVPKSRSISPSTSPSRSMKVSKKSKASKKSKTGKALRASRPITLH